MITFFFLLYNYIFVDFCVLGMYLNNINIEMLQYPIVKKKKNDNKFNILDL